MTLDYFERLSSDKNNLDMNTWILHMLCLTRGVIEAAPADLHRTQIDPNRLLGRVNTLLAPREDQDPEQRSAGNDRLADLKKIASQFSSQGRDRFPDIWGGRKQVVEALADIRVQHLEGVARGDVDFHPKILGLSQEDVLSKAKAFLESCHHQQLLPLSSSSMSFENSPTNNGFVFALARLLLSEVKKKKLKF